MASLFVGSLAATLALLITPVAGRAETREQAATGNCRLTPIGRHTVAAIVDAETIRLDDGREVRLADLRAPRATDVAGAAFVDGGRAAGIAAVQPAPAVVWPLEQAVIAVLGRRLVGRTVVIATDERPGARLTDRYGRLVAHVLADDPPMAIMGNPHDAAWLQAALLRDGFVRLEHGPGEAPCLTRLLVHEQAAREARRGLWREAAYAVRDTTKPHTLSRFAGTLQAVEGSVVRAGVVRGRVYLDFGRERNRDFTASMQKSVARQLAQRGIEPGTLGGRRVRITGWLEWRGRPWIEITHADQIELIQEARAVRDGAAGGVSPQDAARERLDLEKANARP